MSAHHQNLTRRDTQRSCEQRHDRLVRSTTLGRFGHRNLQRVAQRTDDPVARRAGNDLDREPDAVGLSGEGDQATNRFTMIVSFCPPKPKLLLTATSTFAGRALFGT